MHDNVFAPKLASFTIRSMVHCRFKAVAQILLCTYACITQVVGHLHGEGCEAAFCVLAGFDGMIPLVEHAKIHSVYQMMASN